MVSEQMQEGGDSEAIVTTYPALCDAIKRELDTAGGRTYPQWGFTYQDRYSPRVVFCVWYQRIYLGRVREQVNGWEIAPTRDVFTGQCYDSQIAASRALLRTATRRLRERRAA